MEIEFTFNASDRFILKPTNGKDKQLLQLCFGDSRQLRVVASPREHPEWVAIEVEKQAPANIAEQVELEHLTERVETIHGSR